MFLSLPESGRRAALSSASRPTPPIQPIDFCPDYRHPLRGKRLQGRASPENTFHRYCGAELFKKKLYRIKKDY